MNANIDKTGKLIIKPMTSTEGYALKIWIVENTNHIAATNELTIKPNQILFEIE